MIPTPPPPEPGKKKALVLAAAVHLALVLALFYGVHWKRSQPETVEVELWSSRPAPAPAAPPPPPPPAPEPRPEPKLEPKPEPKPEVKTPTKPDIALKLEKKPPEPKKPEPEPKKPEPKPEPKKTESKAEPRKPEPAPNSFREALEREEKQRQAADTQARLAAAAATEAQGLRAAASQRGLNDYAAKIRTKIRGNIMLPPALQGNPEAIFEVNQLPSGEVLSVKLRKSSGNAALDNAIERAIFKSSPLPRPDDLSLFQRTLDIKYRPFEE